VTRTPRTSKRWVVASIVLAGCLLPTPPPAPRYFAPVLPPSSADGVPAAVDLASVRAPLHLREQIAWRRSDVEYGFYEQRRWTELPSTYVERALSRELFGGGEPLMPTGSTLPVLRVEVRAFEEVLAPTHEARVAIALELVHGGCVRLRQVVAASRPLDGDDPLAVVHGIGDALDEVAHTAGGAVRTALAERTRCANTRP
jgi:ABC-type uncharacterized transport system auxiliary subunit